MGIAKEIKTDIYLFLEDNIDRLLEKYPGSENIIAAVLFEYAFSYNQRLNDASSVTEE